MSSPAKTTAISTTKGKTVGVWLSGDALDALKKLGEKNEYFREGTYCAEAVNQRLQREGHLKEDADSEVAAQAFELSRTLGSEAVRTKLLELAAASAPAAEAAR